MAKLKGTLIASTIVTTDSQDTFATHLASLGKGSYRSVQSLAERDAIPDERRERGMLVFVNTEKTLYRLTTGITNADYENLGSGSSLLKRKVPFQNTDLIIIPDIDDYSIIEVWLYSDIYRPAVFNEIVFNQATFNQYASEGAKRFEKYDVIYDIENKELIVQLLSVESGVIVLY